MSSYSLTKSRAFQYVGILLALVALAAGYWYFSVRAGVTQNKTATGSLTSGLVGYWTFDGADISGTTATDRSGNANNGTLTNGPTKTEGKLGQALNFDGTNDYVDMGNPASLQLAGSITLSTWFKAGSFPGGDDNGLIAKGNGSLAYHLNITRDNGPEQVYMLISKTGASPGANAGQRYTTTTFVAGQWYHMAGVYNATAQTIDLYVNGVLDNGTLVGTIPNSVNNTGDPLRVGDAWAGNYYAGSIDETRIYNRALSAGEVKSLFDLGASDKVNTAATQPGGAGLASGLAGYWKLDENTGTSAGDASTNGNSGTLTNGPTWTTGRIGSAVNFDGTNDEITIPHSAALEPDDLTLSVWVKRNGSQGANDQIIGKDTSASGSNTWSYALEWDSGGTAIQWEVDDNSLASFPFVTSAVIPDATWTLVTGTYRNSTKVLELFVNGVSQGTTTLPGTRDKGTTGIVLGRYNGGGGEFNGSLDEVRIYNRVLSADEVGQLYRLTTPTGVDTSLKGYWSFNGSDTTGTTAYDRSGAGNTGTLTNGPTITEGKLGQALSLDGSNDYVSVTDPGTSSALDFANGNSITLSTWVKPDAFDGTWGSIVGKETSNSIYSPNYAILHSNSCSGSSPCPLMFYYDSGSCNETAQQMFVTSGNVLTPGVWQFITVIYTFGTGSTVKVYVDGNEKSGSWTSGNGNVAPCQGNEPFRIGIDYDGDMFDGQIDETRIYNRALSANEVKSLYDLGASDKVNTSVSQLQGTGRLDSGLAGYWKLDENTGTSAADTSTNASTGTLTNGPTWTTGRIGSAVTFDGTNDYIEMGNVATFNSLSRVTASAWVKTASLATEKHIVDKSHCDGGTNSAVFELYGGYAGVGRPGFAIYKNGGTPDLYQVESTARVDDNAWHLVTGVYDGANLIIYVDGVNTGQTAAAGITMPSTTNTLQIGGGLHWLRVTLLEWHHRRRPRLLSGAVS